MDDERSGVDGPFGDDDFLPLDLSPFDDDPSPPVPRPAPGNPEPPTLALDLPSLAPFAPLAAEVEQPILAEVASRSPFAPRLSPPAGRAGAFDYIEPPRLGIIHLLAWTAAAAAFLSYSVVMLQAESGFLTQLTEVGRLFYRALISAHGVLQGAALVGALVVVRARLHQPSRRLQPGHWLLVVGTAAVVVRMTLWGIKALIENAWQLENDTGMGAIALAGGLPLVLSGAGFWLATLVTELPRRWKLLFGFLGTMCLLQALSFLALLTPGGFQFMDLAFSGLWPVLTGVFLLVVVVIDVAARSRRDWLHRLGVAVLGLTVLLEIGWKVWMVCLRPFG